MFTIALLILGLVLTPQTIAFSFTQPARGSIIDLSSTNVTITWTTNSTDPDLINLFFGGADFANGLAVNLSTSPSHFYWNAAATSHFFASTNVTFYLGSPFYVFAGSTTGEGEVLATGPNCTIKDYAGPTSNATGFPNTNGGAASSSAARIWVCALAAVLISAFTTLS